MAMKKKKTPFNFRSFNIIVLLFIHSALFEPLSIIIPHAMLCTKHHKFVTTGAFTKARNDKRKRSNVLS